MSPPTVGAALMVRNEQAEMPAALRNLLGRGLREVVVLDTGSTDRTVKLATRPGVRVVEEPWRTEKIGDVTTIADFGAGRNRSIELCEHSDYVLLTDADYRWPKGVIERMLVKLAEHPDVAVGYAMLNNAQGSQDSAEDVCDGRRRRGDAYPVIQLVRRVRGPWYENPIHELADTWARREIEAGGLSAIVGSVAHYGHTPSACQAKRKTERNLAILVRWAERENHPQAWVYIGVMMLGDDVNDPTRAGVALGQAWTLREDPRARGHLVRLAHGMTSLLLRLRDAEKALDALDTLEVIHRPHPDFDVLRGQVMQACGKWKEAAHFYRASLEPSRRRDIVAFVPVSTVAEKLREVEARAA